MRNSRTAQLIFQSFYCAFALTGTLGGLYFTDRAFRWDFYLFFTNISGYLCMGVMAAGLIQTARKKADSPVTAAPRLKFAGLLGTALTFLVFNGYLMRLPGRDPADNWKIGSIMFHQVLPAMYAADWFLFYERGRVKPSWPLLAGALPLGYTALIYLHAFARGFDTSIINYSGNSPLIYPYPFFNPEVVGIGGAALAILVLLLVYLAIGYLFWLVDRQLGQKAR